jgi:ribosomal protein S7
MDKDTLKKVLTDMKPIIAQIEDKTQRKAVVDALMSRLATDSKKDSANIMNALAGMQKAHNTNSIEEVQKAYDALNPHTRKEVK